jgi:hypothetical protein
MTKSAQTAVLKDTQERLHNLTQQEFAQTRLYLGIRQSKDELVNSVKRQIEQTAKPTKPSK